MSTRETLYPTCKVCGAVWTPPRWLPENMKDCCPDCNEKALRQLLALKMKNDAAGFGEALASLYFNNGNHTMPKVNKEV